MIVTIKENYDNFVGYFYHSLQENKGLININGKASVCSEYEENNKRWIFSGNTKKEIIDLIEKKLNDCYTKREIISTLRK